MAIFYEFNSKKSAKFLFSKNHRDLENEYFFKSWLEPSYHIKDQLPKLEFKIRGCLAFFFFFNMSKTIFDQKNSKKNTFSSFFFIFSFKKNKEHILFQVKPLKMSNKSFFVLVFVLFWDFRGFLRPCFAMRRVKKQ